MKRVGGAIYVHKSAIDTLTQEDQKRVEAAASLFPETFAAATIIKVNHKDQSVTFIYSHDWDTANEPEVGNAINIKPDGSHRTIKASGKIYHHKWMFVKPDYAGFDVEASKKRSKQWQLSMNLDKRDKSLIGNKKYWQLLLKIYGLSV